MTTSHRLAKTVGSLLLALAFVLAMFAIGTSRSDSRDGFPAWVALDVVVGLVVLCGLFLQKIYWRGRFFRVGRSVAGAVLVIASLLWWHGSVAAIPAKKAALEQVTKVRNALDRFKEDCGRFPSQEESLAALIQNPGVENWRGPYVAAHDLKDPWGRELRFQVGDGRDDKADVWSVGPDGQNGTQDDIHVRYFHGCYFGRE
jgi:type II secretion system protein G